MKWENLISFSLPKKEVAMKINSTSDIDKLLENGQKKPRFKEDNAEYLTLLLQAATLLLIDFTCN